MAANAFPFDLNEEPALDSNEEAALDLNEEPALDLNEEPHDHNGVEENFGIEEETNVTSGMVLLTFFLD